MAMSATIALSPSTAGSQTLVKCALTVSNSGGSAVNVTSVEPYIFATSAGAVLGQFPAGSTGEPPISPGFPISVPASGTLIITFYATFFRTSGTSTYSVGAVCHGSDASIFQPTVGTVTVTGTASAVS